MSTARHIFNLLLVSVACVAIYYNSLDAPFVFDDLPNIVENVHVRVNDLSPGTLYESGVRSLIGSRFVANATFAVNYYFGGYDVRGYHWVNISIHLLTGVVFYALTLLTVRQLADLPGQRFSVPAASAGSFALLAALLFIAHPLQTQAVTYIVQRMTSLATLFYLLAVCLYVAGRQASVGWKRPALWAGAALSWGLALGSKEIAATLPLVLWLYEWFFFRNLSRRWLLSSLWYVLALALVMGLIGVAYIGDSPLEHFAARYEIRDFNPWERQLTQFRVLVLYLGLLLYPAPSRLNLLHDIDVSHSLLDPPTTLLSLLLLLGLLAWAVRIARKERLIGFCVFWFFIALAMESSVLWLEMIFEHRLYLPMAAFVLIVSHLLFRLPPVRSTWGGGPALLLVALLGVGVQVRNQAWQDHATLFADILEKSPRSHRAHHSIGLIHKANGDIEAAERYFRRALELEPRAFRTHNVLGNLFAGRGDTEQAIVHYEAALSITPLDSSTHNNLGNVLTEQGKYEEAIEHYFSALRTRPDFMEAHINLGNTLANMGDLELAIRHYSDALCLGLASAVAETNLGFALVRLGRVEEALSHFREALRIDDSNPDAHNSLGLLLARQGKLEEAVRHFRRAVAIDSEFDQAQHNLTIALRLMREGNTETPGN